MKKKGKKKVNNIRQSKKAELITYFDYLTDPRKIKAAQILAYSGFVKGGRNYGAVTLAAKTIGVNRLTIYHWLDSDPEFVSAIEETLSELCAIAVDSLKKMAIKGNPAVCMFLAEKAAPHLYSSQFKKFEHEKEVIRLKAELGIIDEEMASPPIIVIEAPEKESRDYERNKLDN